MADSFADLPARATASLARATAEVDQCSVPEYGVQEIGWAHLQEEQPEWARLRGHIKDFCKGKFALYVVRLQNGHDPEAVQAAFRIADHVPCRSRDNDRISETLYVGSSRKLASRFREHLGFCSKKTYALKLSGWLPSDVSLDFAFALYPGTTSLVALAALEDALWDKLQPMFGRKGAK